ncbi:MAG: hypothetical protein ACRD8W_01815 [Nitrososphaeraceae archaeon]
MLGKDATGLIIIGLFQLASILGSTNSVTSLYTSYGHLEHLPHYNGGESRYGSGKYYSYMALDPEYGIAKEPSRIEFSIQDFDAKDVYNVTTMVEIYETSSGERLDIFPWTFRDIGDFILYYTFPKNGNYVIVLSIASENAIDDRGEKNVLKNEYNAMSDPPRSILGSTTNCSCERTVFNIKINPTFGIIQNSLYAAIIVLPITVLGVILAKNFKRARYSHAKTTGSGKSGSNEYAEYAKFSNNESLKYVIMLLALAGGILHLAVFPEHASLHIYYSVFLLTAAASQVAFGALYVLVTLSDSKYSKMKTQGQAIELYKKNLTINLFGLVGTAVLVGLYVYSIVLPPPLSPLNRPEEISIAGVISKSLEILLFVGIILILRKDRREMQSALIQMRER